MKHWPIVTIDSSNINRICSVINRVQLINMILNLTHSSPSKTKILHVVIFYYSLFLKSLPNGASCYWRATNPLSRQVAWYLLRPKANVPFTTKHRIVFIANPGLFPPRLNRTNHFPTLIENHQHDQVNDQRIAIRMQSTSSVQCSVLLFRHSVTDRQHPWHNK